VTRIVRHQRSVGPLLTAALILLLLTLFLLLPVGSVIIAAFSDGAGGLTLAHVGAAMQQSLFVESFWNSFAVAAWSVLFATLIAVPLAYFTVRFEFRGALLIQTLGVLPLVMPPFVGAVTMQLIFGRSGSVNLLLEDAFGFKLPLMQDLIGVVFVESIHYFPFILMNLVAAMRNIDGSMEESAMNLGARGWRLFRRIVFPLSLPGYVAGASLVFVKVFDDLGTPLVLGQTNMLAPQAYLRITSVGLDDPLGYVISVVMILLSIAALGLSAWTLKGRDFATLQKGGASLRRRRLSGLESVAATSWIVVLLAVVLAPHLGLLLMSFSSVWSFSVLPEGFTLAHYATVFEDAGPMIANTLLYCSLAALVDVVIGVAIAYLILRTRLVGRHWLDWIASASLAIPGVVLAIGFMRIFRDLELPFGGGAVIGSALMIVVAYAVRRLPYAVRSCVAALQQLHISLEEAAQSLGAHRMSVIRRVVVPLMSGGIAAGFITSFMTAAVELSATIMLVSAESQAPMSYGIYLYMQSVSGRGPGAALGVLAVAIVAFGTWLSNRQAERSGQPLQHDRGGG
jgi:iron(III) transport system permease protein